MNLTWHVKRSMVSTALRLLRWSGWYDGFWNHWRTYFKDTEAQGLHILPVHYYSPVPDTRALPPEHWQKPAECLGLQLDVDAGIAALARIARDYGAEWRELDEAPTPSDPLRYFFANDAYGHGDAEVLYAMVRALRPARIIEIGSGRTTCLIAQALRANRRDDPDYECEFVAVEPYPPEYLQPPPPEVTRFERQPLEKLPWSLFASLGPGDLLFIDSSHVVRTGGDVVREYLEILPRLAVGVHVHVHDIFLPFDYPQDWMHDACFFWNEQYLLQAFLAFNTHFEVTLPLHAMARLRPELTAELLPGCDLSKHRLQAFWMRRVDARAAAQASPAAG